MDWSTRRSEVRWYLRQHKWWWKWPVVVAIVAIWGAAFALFLRPWQPSPSSIDDTATPPATTEATDYDFSAQELPTGLNGAPPSDEVDDAEETESSQAPTMTLEELAASLPPLEADTDVVEPTGDDEQEAAPRSSRRPTRSAPTEAEPEPEPTPAPIATPPPTTRPRTTTTTVRPSVDTPLPTFSTRPPSSPTTTVRPVTTTTTPPPTTPPPTTAPPTTAPPPTTVATTLPPAPPPIVTLPAPSPELTD